MTTKTKVILSAGFGGMAPNLFKLAILLTGGPTTLPSPVYIATYSVGLLLLGALGVGTAWALQETDARKAVFIGLGLPAFFQLSASNISQRVSANAEAGGASVISFSLPFVTTAYAEEIASVRRRAPAATVTTPPQVQINVIGKKTPDALMFYSADKEMQQELSAGDFQQGKAAINVPVGMTSVAVKYRGVVSSKVPINKVAPETLDVTIEELPWSGLWQAVGFNKAPPYQVNVKAQP